MSGRGDVSRAMNRMNDRFFLDTNIFVYSFDKNAPKADRAAQLIRQAIEARQGIVSYQVVQEFFNVALRRFAEPMSAAEAEQYLSTIFHPLLVVHSSHGLYSRALQLASTHSISWDDSLIVASAIEGRCGILYSEDFQHGQRFGRLRIQNPFL
jgi:predicted nucleic acid-binding protein